VVSHSCLSCLTISISDGLPIPLRVTSASWSRDLMRSRPATRPLGSPYLPRHGSAQNEQSRLARYLGSTFPQPPADPACAAVSPSAAIRSLAIHSVRDAELKGARRRQGFTTFTGR